MFCSKLRTTGTRDRELESASVAETPEKLVRKRPRTTRTRWSSNVAHHTTVLRKKHSNPFIPTALLLLKFRQSRRALVYARSLVK
jgi:hypothetical protein